MSDSCTSGSRAVIADAKDVRLEQSIGHEESPNVSGVDTKLDERRKHTGGAISKDAKRAVA